MTNTLYDKYGSNIALLCCFLIPIKLSLTYICLVPLILLFIFSGKLSNYLKDDLVKKLYMPFLVFVAVAMVTSLFGLHPLNSSRKLLQLGFCSLAVLAFYDLTKQVSIERIILTVCSGHLLSGSYSVVRAAYLHKIDEVFIGAVTQSGQLACSVVLAAGLLLHSKRKITTEPQNQSLLLLGTSTFAVYSFTAFGGTQGIFFALSLSLMAVITCLALKSCFTLITSKNIDFQSYFSACTIFVLPILFANTLANLKRGPWIGILCGVSLLLFLLASRKLYVVVPMALAALSLLIQPVYIRLMQSYTDFFISGGRYLLWQIGFELSSRFPLGIGYDNSSIVKSYSPNIPDELEHFHNNFLNLLVETGYIGLCLLAWWLVRIWHTALFRQSSKSDIISVSIGCAVFAWQVAGIVEYNFGDSEITILIFLLIGLLIGSTAQNTQRLTNP